MDVRCISLPSPAATREAWSKRSIAWGRRAFYCPMPAIVRNSALLSVPVFFAYLPITFFHLARLIRRKKIDVINCHYLTPYFIHLVIAARLLRVPVVVSVHGADIDGYADSSPAAQARLPADHARRPPHRRVLRGPGQADDRGVSGRALEGHVRAQRPGSLALRGGSRSA